jgi:hypothetical protein
LGVARGGSPLMNIKAAAQCAKPLIAPSTPDEYTRSLEAQIGLAEQMMKVAHLEPQ